VIKKVENISAVILAAGKSERMGFPKALLRYNSSMTFIQKIESEFVNFGCDSVILVVNALTKKQIEDKNLAFSEVTKIVVNPHPEWERFHSLWLGVKALDAGCSIFMNNIDNPFISQDLLQQLYMLRNDADYIKPTINGRGGHPALLSGKVVSEVMSQTNTQQNLKVFLSGYHCLPMPVNNELVLTNINSRDDYKKYFG